MLVDILIVILGLSALVRGHEIGFLRQAGSTAGFLAGLFLGAWLQPHTVKLVHGQSSRALVTLLTTLGCALIIMSLGEYGGLRLKRKVRLKRINHFDNWFGSALGIVSLLLSAWLTAAIVSTMPVPAVQSALHDSHIINGLNRELPAAPSIISELGRLIDPNGFPQVFIGGEPTPPSNVSPASAGSLQAAVNQDEASVVKIEGQGCGEIIEGSGFVVGPDEVATNAHVVAGVRQPEVEDSKGTHNASVIWFDPKLDFAVLRVNGLAGFKLPINTSRVSTGTAAAVLGYPGGGPLTVGPASVLDEFTAVGRDIYGSGTTQRDVYEIQATVIPGNSGGPLIGQDGRVIGVVFAESSTYQHVGYALTTSQVKTAINQAIARNQVVSTGQCAE